VLIINQLQKNNSIDYSYPSRNKIPKGGQLKIVGISLNDMDENNELKSLMFGGLRKIINQFHKLGFKEDMENYGFDLSLIDFFTNKNNANSLSKKIAIIHTIRNPHSHTKAMSYENYKELRSNVIEPELKSEESVLGKIAEMKCMMNKKYN
jgi:hypothetical protein